MDKIYLYLFGQYEVLPDRFVAEHINLLPVPRQEQCARYRQMKDQQNCVIAYLLLLRGLREQYGIAEPGAFAYSKNGKPYLKDYPSVFFNISHCRHGVICALANFEVGVDIQDVQPYDPAIARRVCSEGELRLLSETDDPARLFCQFWVQKESYAKATGIGLADVLKKELFDCHTTTFAKEGRYIALTHLQNRQFHLCYNRQSWPAISPL